jgi:hypothetical protein
MNTKLKQKELFKVLTQKKVVYGYTDIFVFN